MSDGIPFTDEYMTIAPAIKRALTQMTQEDTGMSATEHFEQAQALLKQAQDHLQQAFDSADVQTTGEAPHVADLLDHVGAALDGVEEYTTPDPTIPDAAYPDLIRRMSDVDLAFLGRLLERFRDKPEALANMDNDDEHDFLVDVSDEASTLLGVLDTLRVRPTTVD